MRVGDDPGLPHGLPTAAWYCAPFPGFGRFCIDVRDLTGIYPGLAGPLREVKGIYVLVDKKTGHAAYLPGNDQSASAVSADALHRRPCRRKPSRCNRAPERMFCERGLTDAYY